MSTIDHPSHYAEGREYEPIDVIEDWNLGFSLGNAVKYISRAGRKDPSTKVEDLKKAIWYINREIERTLAYGYAQQNTDYFDRWENPEVEQSNS
jgi:hypothetical protein